METDPGGGVPESATFAQTLGTLKEEGSNILLVGERAKRAHGSACRRLLGEVNADSRYRLFVVTDEASCPTPPCEGAGGRWEPRTPTGDDRSRTRVIGRSDSGRPHDGDGAAVPESVVGTELLSVLGSEVVETVDELEADANGFEPSQLRLCVDSLAPLLTNHDAENVFRFLHLVTARARHVAGMGHYHLPVERDHDAVRLLEPLFDATVEVRSHAGSVEQRWHLRDGETSSDWIAL